MLGDSLAGPDGQWFGERTAPTLAQERSLTEARHRSDALEAGDAVTGRSSSPESSQRPGAPVSTLPSPNVGASQALEPVTDASHNHSSRSHPRQAVASASLTSSSLPEQGVDRQSRATPTFVSPPRKGGGIEARALGNVEAFPHPDEDWFTPEVLASRSPEPAVITAEPDWWLAAADELPQLANGATTDLEPARDVEERQAETSDGGAEQQVAERAAPPTFSLGGDKGTQSLDRTTADNAGDVVWAEWDEHGAVSTAGAAELEDALAADMSADTVNDLFFETVDEPATAAAAESGDEPQTPEWLDDVLDQPAPIAGPSDDDSNEAWRAGARAAELVERLDLTKRDERDAAFRWLDELLREFASGSSHRAIGRLVQESCSFDELRMVAVIKRAWAADPSCWLMRRYNWGERQPVVWIDRRAGRHALSWRAAARLAAACGPDEALDLLRGDWRDAWLGLSPGEPGYLRFTEFVALQCSHHGDQALASGLRALDAGGRLDEFCDGYRWFDQIDEGHRAAVVPDRRPKMPAFSAHYVLSGERGRRPSEGET